MRLHFQRITDKGTTIKIVTSGSIVIRIDVYNTHIDTKLATFSGAWQRHRFSWMMCELSECRVTIWPRPVTEEEYQSYLNPQALQAIAARRAPPNWGSATLIVNRGQANLILQGSGPHPITKELCEKYIPTAKLRGAIVKAAIGGSVLPRVISTMLTTAV